MPRFHKQRVRFGHHHEFPFQSAIWMIGIGILMLWGHWWPGILILIGLSMILGGFWKVSVPQPLEPLEPPDGPSAPVAPQPPAAPKPIIPPAPASVTRRTDLLPANCPRCGGPVRANEVRWIGMQSAACAYCGATLPISKK